MILNKIAFRIKPIPTRDVQRVQTNLVHTRTQRSHRDWTRTVFECLLQRYRSVVDCCRDRGSGYSRLGYGISPLGGDCHLPTIVAPELTQDWETDSWRAQTKSCLHQDPGERRSDPSGDTQTQFCLTLWVLLAEGMFEYFWWVWDLILNVISPLLLSCWG